MQNPQTYTETTPSTTTILMDVKFVSCHPRSFIFPRSHHSQLITGANDRSTASFPPHTLIDRAVYCRLDAT